MRSISSMLAAVALSMSSPVVANSRAVDVPYVMQGLPNVPPMADFIGPAKRKTGARDFRSRSQQKRRIHARQGNSH